MYMKNWTEQPPEIFCKVPENDFIPGNYMFEETSVITLENNKREKAYIVAETGQYRLFRYSEDESTDILRYQVTTCWFSEAVLALASYLLKDQI